MKITMLTLIGETQILLKPLYLQHELIISLFVFPVRQRDTSMNVSILYDNGNIGDWKCERESFIFC